MTNNFLISTTHLRKRYQLGGSEIWALDGVDLTVNSGEFISIVGASGSGKSTLLNLLAGLDTPTEGSIRVPEGELSKMSSRRIARYRAYEVGMVFQSFNLIPHRTALENVAMALLFSNISLKERERRAREILHRLGLSDRLKHRPADMSGGEQQRVAIARALVKNPQLLLADEPTGNLDKENSEIIAQMLGEWNGQGGTVILVSHNLELAGRYSGRVLKLRYGKFIDDTL
jgi:putative ABC transport system ATP-binding protein